MNRLQIAVFWPLLAIALVAGIAAAEQGQTSDIRSDQGQERILSGHAFLPSQYVRDPWISTRITNSTGGGVATGLETPFYNLAGEKLFTLKGDLVYGALGFGFQQQLGQSNAVGLKLAAVARTGTNAQTLVADGANVDRSLNLWFKHRLLRSQNSQMTVGVDWDYAKTFLVDPAGFARAIIDGEDLDSAPLLAAVKSWTARIALEYAHAFSPTYAFRANGAVGLYEVAMSPGVSKATHRLGLLLEMDLKHKHGVPLGLTLGRTQGYPGSDRAAGLSGTLFGLYYTGRNNFVVGLDTGFMTLPIQDLDKKINVMTGIFTVRYYF